MFRSCVNMWSELALDHACLPNTICCENSSNFEPNSKRLVWRTRKNFQNNYIESSMLLCTNRTPTELHCMRQPHWGSTMKFHCNQLTSFYGKNFSSSWPCIQPLNFQKFSNAAGSMSSILQFTSRSYIRQAFPAHATLEWLATRSGLEKKI